MPLQLLDLQRIPVFLHDDHRLDVLDDDHVGADVANRLPELDLALVDLGRRPMGVTEPNS